MKPMMSGDTLRRLGPSPRCRLLFALAVWLFESSALYAWGPTGHRLANDWAVDTLPSEVRGFFAANRQFLMDHSSDPDDWTKKDRFEARRHFIYLDKYGLFPFLLLPHSFKEAVEKHGSGRINRDGLLPWRIGEYSLRLTNALRAHDWDEVKLDAAVLGHYVADARQPLNTTQNFDGQLTREPGLAQRFGVRLIDRYANFFISRPEAAAKIDDPTEYAFDICLEAHTRVEQIILADRQSLEGLRGYDDDYFDRFYTHIGSTAMQEISQAAHDTGSYWYSAWLNAGRPEPPGR